MNRVRHKKSRIRIRIIACIWICVLPLAGLVGYALFRLYSYHREYDQLVKNITGTNTYNMSFKESMDETMYRIIIGSANWTDPEQKLKGDNPKDLIRGATDYFTEMRDNATEANVRSDLDQIVRLLDILDERVDDILANVEEGGHYDENMELLDMNIRTLTSLVQEDIQKYIYDEAANMEQLRRSVAASLVTTIRALVILLIVILLFIFIMSRRLTKSITEPIDELCDMTERFARGDFTVSYHPNSKDEMETLAESFNSMVGEIKTLVEDIHREQVNARDAELRLLQEQINPHFLYNTLDAIMWMTEAGENDEAIMMLQELSNFFRTSLSKGQSEITIRTEMEHVKSYLNIQRYRYQDILDFELDFAEDIMDYRVQKLTLQPIVENALYHGIKNKRGKGLIKVSGKADMEDIILTVEDNGIGMNTEELARLRGLIDGSVKDDEQHGFGMANVEQRLQMHYGRAYGMKVDSAYGEGTTVTVRIPKVGD